MSEKPTYAREHDRPSPVLRRRPPGHRSGGRGDARRRPPLRRVPRRHGLGAVPRPGRGGGRRRRTRWPPSRPGCRSRTRADALTHVSRRIAERVEEVARLITAENGKPIKWARAEAARASATFRWAAEEVRREGGELMRLDTEPVAAGRAAIVRRFPKGPVLAIAPFNFPLNLVAHKVAPALAVGRTDHHQAGAGDAAVGAAARRAAGRDRPAGRDVVGADRRATTRCPALVAGPAAAGRLVHRLRSGRLLDHGRGPAQARHARAGRQRRRGRVRRLVVRRRPRLGGHPDRDVRQLPGRPVLRLGAAACSWTAPSTTACSSGSSTRSRRRSPATRATRPPTSGRSSTRRRRGGSRRGSTRRSPAAPRC